MARYHRLVGIIEFLWIIKVILSFAIIIKFHQVHKTHRSIQKTSWKNPANILRTSRKHQEDQKAAVGSGGVGWGYLRPNQFLDRLTVIKMEGLLEIPKKEFHILYFGMSCKSHQEGCRGAFPIGQFQYCCFHTSSPKYCFSNLDIF